MLCSFVAALTDIQQGDYGGSCTLTSCVYQSAKKDQEDAFLAEVTFFSQSDRREILAAYLAAYYHATHRTNEEDCPDQDNQQCPDELEANSDICNEAVTALFSLFGNQRECRTKQAVRDFLDAADSPQDDSILRNLYTWCDNLITKATDGRKVVAISASTAGELSQKLENFTAYAEDDSGNLAVSLTPMVALIGFYFDNPLTRLGVTFLDTPGTSDCNRARKKSAEYYRKFRSHCAILSDESRVKDDSGISKEVRSLRNRGAGRTVIVVTRSDIIKDTTMPSGSKKEKEKSKQLARDVEKIKNALNVAEIEECDAVEKDDVEKIARLAVHKKELEIRVKLAENAERAQRIWMRSESNKKALEEKLQDINATAPIFSISNTEYARHVEGYPAKKTPVLTVERTNIPALRRLISAFPNEARLNEIQHQQEKNLPVLLSRIRLYTEKSPSDRKETMEVHVNYPMKRYATELNGDFDNLEEELSTLLRNIAAQEPAWTKLAGRLCDKWAREFKTPVFLNLLKRDGRRKGNCRIREVNLSAELIEICADDIEDMFHKLGSQLRHYERDIVDHMESLVSDMLQNLQGIFCPLNRISQSDACCRGF